MTRRRINGGLTPARSPRTGMTLFEVVISLMIFLVAVLTLGHLINEGTEKALDVKQQAQASMKCQSKMAEVIIGAETLNGSGTFSDDAEVKDGPTWTYTIESADTSVESLKKVRVTVRCERQNGSVIDAVLEQMVLDPAQRGSTLNSATSTGMP